MLQHSEPLDLNLITVRKIDTGETYVFIYKPGKAAALIWQFMKFAMNRDLSFNWRDAAEASKMVRRMATSEVEA